MFVRPAYELTQQRCVNKARQSKKELTITLAEKEEEIKRLKENNGIATSEPQPRSRLEELTATAPLSGLLFRRYVTSSL